MTGRRQAKGLPKWRACSIGQKLLAGLFSSLWGAKDTHAHVFFFNGKHLAENWRCCHYEVIEIKIEIPVKVGQIDDDPDLYEEV